MNYSNNQLINQSISRLINYRYQADSKLMPEKSCIFTKVVDHGIKTSSFKTELSCGVFTAFSPLFSAYLVVYVLNPTYKKIIKYICALFSLI